MLAVARLRLGLAPALLAVHALAAGRTGAVRSGLAARAVMAFALMLAMLAMALVLALLMLLMLLLAVLLVLVMACRLRGGGGGDRERERGNDDLHFKSPEKKVRFSQARRGGGGSDPGAVLMKALVGVSA